MIAATSLASQFDTPLRRSRAGSSCWPTPITDPAELCSVLGLDPALVAPAHRGRARASRCACRAAIVAPHAARRSARSAAAAGPAAGAPNSTHVAGFTTDPVGDLAQPRAPRAAAQISRPRAAGRDRRLRRALPLLFSPPFPLREESALHQGWRRRARARCAPITSISEVILSGGDPLSLSDRRLAQLTRRAAGDPARAAPAHPHALSRSCCPERIDAGLLDWLHGAAAAEGRRHPCQPRATRSTRRSRDACRELARAGATLLNQSVLLAGVNDSVDALAELSEALFATQRAALLPAPAGQGAGRRALRRRRARALAAARGTEPHACPAIWCRDWCAKSPARQPRLPVTHWR